MTYAEAPIDIQDFLKWSWNQSPGFARFQVKLQVEADLSRWIHDSFQWFLTPDQDAWEAIWNEHDSEKQIQMIRKTKFYAKFFQEYVPSKPFDPHSIADMRHSIEKISV